MASTCWRRTIMTRLGQLCPENLEWRPPSVLVLPALVHYLEVPVGVDVMHGTCLAQVAQVWRGAICSGA